MEDPNVEKNRSALLILKSNAIALAAQIENLSVKSCHLRWARQGADECAKQIDNLLRETE